MNYIQPDDIKLVSLSGVGVVFKISAVDTGGLFSVVEHPLESGRFVRPHTQTRKDEFSYVLECEIEERIGEQIFQASPSNNIILGH